MKTEKQILSIIKAACAKEREVMKAGDAAAVERLDALTTLAADIVLTPELKPSEEQPIGEEYAIEIGKDVHTLRVGSQSDINRLIAQDRQEQPEADLEKEYERFVASDPVYSKLTNGIVGKAIARHFYELGLNARKEDTK